LWEEPYIISLKTFSPPISLFILSGNPVVLMLGTPDWSSDFLNTPSLCIFLIFLALLSRIFLKHTFQFYINFYFEIIVALYWFFLGSFFYSTIYRNLI
jgi:hypothetical protein